jgi:sugar transferase (PEP-CTERM/EpsH1 system associated)
MSTRKTGLETVGELPLIAHVVFRLGVGGLENGLINIVNRMPAETYRHAVICIDKSTSFEKRITKADVPIFSIGKKPGRDWRASKRLFDLIRRLRPAIAHTRNLGAMDAVLPAWLAGVRVRVHGEHGLDVSDLKVSKLKYRILRRLHAPLVTHYVAVSRQLSTYLQEKVGIDGSRVTEIPNGVDSQRFTPPLSKRAYRQRLIPDLPEDVVVVGSVGRLEAVKDPLNLIAAVASLRNTDPSVFDRIRLVIVGDGSLREQITTLVDRNRIAEKLLLTGMRDDVPDILAALDVFVSPSLAEGFSNTILEAMACGLPVVATDVGENARLVIDGQTGRIVPPGDPEALGAAIAEYCRSPGRIRGDGAEARRRVEFDYTLDRMVSSYQSVYDRCLGIAR